MAGAGKDIIDPMLGRIKGMPNVVLELNTKFESFVLQNDKENGRSTVAGIKVSHGDGEAQEVFCTKGVVLASGGFSADIPFRSVSV